MDKEQLAAELSRLSEQDARDVMAGLAEHERQRKMQAGAEAIRAWLHPTLKLDEPEDNPPAKVNPRNPNPWATINPESEDDDA